MCFATKTTADFGRRYLELCYIHSEQFSAGATETEMPLRCYPQLARIIRADISKAGVRLYIALVGLFGFECFFDNNIGLCKTGLDITVAKLRYFADIAWFAGFPVSNKIVNNGCAWFHGLIYIGNMR